MENGQSQSSMVYHTRRKIRRHYCSRHAKKHTSRRWSTNSSAKAQANYEPRFFVSNYQKVGYVKNGVNVILKPVRRFSYEPGDADPKTVDENLKEGIAFYQQADRWEENMRRGE